MGVVAGITLSYQFGTNWSRFSTVTANIVAPLRDSPQQACKWRTRLFDASAVYTTSARRWRFNMCGYSLLNATWSVGTATAAILLVASHSAEAQVANSGYSLPLSLAVEAATEAIHSCEGQGYAVSASVVDTSGVVKVQLKGDHSTIHTQDTSFRKAYTLVTFGPIFNLDATSQIAELAKNPAGPGPALTSIPNVLALAGGAAIKHGNEIVAALGVGGAPGGAKDEVCAKAGVAKIRERVEAAAAPLGHSTDGRQ